MAHWDDYNVCFIPLLRGCENDGSNMKYTSPFHLLQERNTSAFTDDNLKRWKKELMLQFDLNQSTIININRKEYDKSDILQIFDNLKDNPEYHWQLYQNKPLLEFIEDGYVDFFDNEESWADFENTSYRNWLAQWFMPQYDDTIFQIAESENPNNPEIFETLAESNFRLPEEWQDQALTKTHRFFSNFIKKAEETLEYGVLHGKKIGLPPQTHPYVDEYYWNILKLLPENFDGMRDEYAELMYNTVALIFYPQRRLKDVDRKTLETLQIASKITYDYYQDKDSWELNVNIKAHLIEEDKHWTSPSKLSGWAVQLCFMLFISMCGVFLNNDDDTFETHVIPYERVNNSYNSTNNFFKQTYNSNNTDIYIGLISGKWKANFMNPQYAGVEKTLEFKDKSAGKASIKIPGKKEDDFCAIKADFTWIKNGNNISILYEKFKITREFEHQDDNQEAIRRHILRNYTEQLSTDNPFNQYGLVTLEKEHVRYYKKSSSEIQKNTGK